MKQFERFQVTTPSEFKIKGVRLSFVKFQLNVSPTP